MTTNQTSLRLALALFCVALCATISLAQEKTTFPEDQLRQEEFSAHLRFLASDELRGRLTGTPWIDVAARYIAEQFSTERATTPWVQPL